MQPPPPGWPPGHPPGPQPPPPQYGQGAYPAPGYPGQPVTPGYASRPGYPPAGLPWGPPPFGMPLPPAPKGPRPSVRGLGWVGVAAAVLGVLGSRLRWAEIRGFAQQGVYVADPEIEGSELGVGTFCLILALAIGALSAVLVWRTVLGCAIAVLSVGCVLLVIAGANAVSVDQIADPGIERYGLSASISIGLWMTVAAGALASAVGIAATVRASTRRPLPSRWDAPVIAPPGPPR